MTTNTGISNIMISRLLPFCISLGLFAASCTQHQEYREGPFSDRQQRAWPIEPDWLQQQVTIDDLRERTESGLAELEEEGFPEEVVTRIRARKLAEVQEFANRLRPGDTLWHYRSPKATWHALAGRDGYLALRGCRAVEDFVFERN